MNNKVTVIHTSIVPPPLSLSLLPPSPVACQNVPSILNIKVSGPLKPLSRATIKRAEDADPNSRRCLIENSSTNQGIQAVHVVDRNLSRLQGVVRNKTPSIRLVLKIVTDGGFRVGLDDDEGLNKLG